jgi:hypothetical protein
MVLVADEKIPVGRRELEWSAKIEEFAVVGKLVESGSRDRGLKRTETPDKPNWINGIRLENDTD